MGSMSNVIPSPPVFRASVVQMQRPQQQPQQPQEQAEQENSYLTSSLLPSAASRARLVRQSPSISPMTHCISPVLEPVAQSPLPSRKRRHRDSKTHKSNKAQQHSVIEKKRRIKMNREFEALKFIVPACRTSIIGGLSESNSFENSHLMHKLTILQSTVEYIKYLHLIIRLMKLQMLAPKETRPAYKSWFKKNSNLDFANFDLSLDKYRDIDKDFDFEDMFLQVWKNDAVMPEKWLDPITIQITRFLNSDDSDPKAPEDAEKPPSSSPPPSSKLCRSSSVQERLPMTPMSLLSNELPSRRPSFTSQQNSNSSVNAGEFRLPLPAINESRRYSPPNRELPIPIKSVNFQSSDYQGHQQASANMSPYAQNHLIAMKPVSFNSFSFSSISRTPSTGVSDSAAPMSNTGSGIMHNYSIVNQTPNHQHIPPLSGPGLVTKASKSLPNEILNEEHEASQVLISLRSNSA